MIQAVIFDLDGTLVETERLKALSYARAAEEMCPGCGNEEDQVQAFKDVVGRSRQEVAETLIKRFGLEDAARNYMERYQVNTPWQAFLQLRLEIFQKMIDDPDIIKENQLPCAIELLHEVRREGYKTGLTTTSDCRRTTYILRTIGVLNEFDFIVTSDDVEHTKPDPEVYCVVTHHLVVDPNDCIAIEDSLAGVKSALAAGVHCIAVPTPFTQSQVRSAQALDDQWIVDDPSKLSETFHRMVEELQ